MWVGIANVSCSQGRANLARRPYDSRCMHPEATAERLGASTPSAHRPGASRRWCRRGWRLDRHRHLRHALVQGVRRLPAVSADRRLCVTLFLLALAIELYGTSLHGWRDYTVEPWVGLTTTNPPVWIGAVYCTLETLEQFVASRRESSQVIARKPLAGSPASALL